MSRMLPLALLLTAAILVACGDSKDDAPGTGGGGASTSDGRRFVAAGDKLCRRLAERFPRVRAQRSDQSPAGVLKAVSAYREFTREMSSGLASLDAPDDEQAKVILSLSSRLASRAREQKLLQTRVVAAQKGGDRKAVFSAALSSARAEQQMMRDIAAPLDARMRSYGFKVCGRPQSFGAKKATTRKGR